MYSNHMRISWDPLKAKTNYRKHKVRFSDAESVLFDPLAMTLEDGSIAVETPEGWCRLPNMDDARNWLAQRG